MVKDWIRKMTNTSKNTKNKSSRKSKPMEVIQVEAKSKKAKVSEREVQNKGQNSLTISTPEGDRILGSFDNQISYLKQMLPLESPEDIAKYKEVGAKLKRFQKDSQKLAARVEGQNRKTQTIMQGLSSIKNGEGVIGKGKAVLKLTGLVVDKTPVIGRNKQYHTKGVLGNLQLHHELKKQFNLATSIKDTLDSLLHGEKSVLKKTRDTLIDKLQEYRSSVLQSKERYRENETKIEGLNTEKQEGVRELKEQYKKSFAEISIIELDENNMKKYSRVGDIDIEILKLTEKQKGLEREVECFAKDIGDAQTNLQMYALFFVQGEEQYRNMDKVLEHAEPNIDARYALSQMKTCVIEGAQLMNHLVKNYRDVVQQDSEHLLQLAKSSDYLIKDTLTSTPTLLNVSKNLKKTAEIQLERAPIETVKQIGEALEGAPALLTGDYQRPALNSGKETNINADNKK